MPIGFIGIAEFGSNQMNLPFLEQGIFRYNQGPGEIFGLRYSDLDGYGGQVPIYLIYKIYWATCGLLFFGLSFLLWRRGIQETFAERLKIMKARFKGKFVLGFVSVLLIFASLGFTLFYESNIQHQYFTRKQKRAALSIAEKKYKKYEKINQPKIVDVKINMALFPKDRYFRANGEYTIVNLSQEVIDTLVINYIDGVHTTYHFDKEVKTVSEDAIANLGHFDILTLGQSMLPGDSLKMFFENYSDPKTIFRAGTFVKYNGTYIEDDIFPRFGNWLSFLKQSNQMGGDNHRPHPEDSTALQNSFMARDADRIQFEATVSTSKNQIAIAPGALQKKWEKEDRQYFHYKTDRKIGLILFIYVWGI